MSGSRVLGLKSAYGRIHLESRSMTEAIEASHDVQVECEEASSVLRNLSVEVDVARVGPMAGDVTGLKMPQLPGFSSLSQSSLREQFHALRPVGSCRINPPRACCLDRSF